MTEQITVTENMIDSLNATRPWVKFIAILGFVLTVLMVLGGIIATLSSFASPARTGMLHFFGPVVGILYIVMAIFLYVIPCTFLLRYGNAIGDIDGSGGSALEDALKHQKSFWKYMGIFAIVVIVLYLIGFVGVMYMGGMHGMHGMQQHT